MSKQKTVTRDTTLHVRDTCLCLRSRRAMRALARVFDAAMKPVGLTNGQFSLMMGLNRPEPPAIGEGAELLAMDRTTLTAMLKPPARRRLVEVRADAADRRTRRPRLTTKGEAALASAVAVWRATHAQVEAGLDDGGRRLRADLPRLTRNDGP